MKLNKSVKEGKRIIAYYQIAILFLDGKKIVKPRCTLEELFETYFINLDKLSKGKETEELYKLYQENFANKGIKIAINYVDSWGHTWKGKCAWPRKEKFIEYLNKKLNENCS